MIIFYAQPNIVYPELANNLTLHHNAPYQFWEPFEVIDKKDEKKALELKQIVYKFNQKIPRRINYNPNHFNCDINTNGLNGPVVVDFCYGLFKKERLLKARGDFVFTIIRHPIKRVHDMYYYMIQETNSIRLNNAFKDIKEFTIEEFIDHYLKEKGILKFKHEGINFKMIDEVTRMPDIKYDFVGIDEHLKISLSLLEVHLGYSPIVPIKKKRKYDYIDYKYKELKEFLKTDIELYNKYSNELMQITKQIMEIQ